MGGKDEIGALHAVRVLDLSRGPAGADSARILGDLGADVLRIDEADQAPTSAYRALNRNKRSIVLGDLPAAHRKALIVTLAAEADVIIDDGALGASGQSPAELARDPAGRIVCLVTPYGQTGPLRDVVADEPVLQAHCGLMAVTGHSDDAPGGGPVQIGAPLVTGLTAVNAAIAVIAALFHRRRHSGEGQVIDIAGFDVGVTMQSHVVQNYLISGRQPQRRGNSGNGGHPAQTFHCADGILYVSAGTNQHYGRLCEALGVPDLAVDPRFTSLLLRDRNRADIDAVLGPLLLGRSRDELMTLLVAAGVPCSPVNDYRDILKDPHVRNRGLAVSLSKHERGIASPLRLPASPVQYRPAPRPGADTASVDVENPWRHARLDDALGGGGTVRPAMPPLAGVKVLDLGRVLAAPWSTQMLADLGAEVIKVERPGHGDDARLYGPDCLLGPEGARTLESAFHLAANRNKGSVVIDIATSEGQAALKARVADSDIVLENFIAGSLARYGLDANTLRRARPDLIYCSLTGYGQSGPYSDRPGYDAVFQAQGGLMAVTGLADGEPGAGPLKTGPSLMDVSTGHYAALAMITALYHRARSGEGQHVDVALMDVALAMQATSLQTYFDDGLQAPRRGNAVGLSPTGVYGCQDGLIFISVQTENARARLGACLSSAGEDGRLVSERAAVDWEKPLADTFGSVTRDEALHRLRMAGVPAAPVADYAAVFSDPQTQARRLSRTVAHPSSATGQATLLASPLNLSRTPVLDPERPPRLGELSPREQEQIQSAPATAA